MNHLDPLACCLSAHMHDVRIAMLIRHSTISGFSWDLRFNWRDWPRRMRTYGVHKKKPKQKKQRQTTTRSRHYSSTIVNLLQNIAGQSWRYTGRINRAFKNGWKGATR